MPFSPFSIIPGLTARDRRPGQNIAIHPLSTPVSNGLPVHPPYDSSTDSGISSSNQLPPYHSISPSPPRYDLDGDDLDDDESEDFDAYHLRDRLNLERKQEDDRLIELQMRRRSAFMNPDVPASACEDARECNQEQSEYEEIEDWQAIKPGMQNDNDDEHLDDEHQTNEGEERSQGETEHENIPNAEAITAFPNGEWHEQFYRTENPFGHPNPSIPTATTPHHHKMAHFPYPHYPPH